MTVLYAKCGEEALRNEIVDRRSRERRLLCFRRCGSTGTLSVSIVFSRGIPVLNIKREKKRKKRRERIMRCISDKIINCVLFNYRSAIDRDNESVTGTPGVSARAFAKFYEILSPSNKLVSFAYRSCHSWHCRLTQLDSRRAWW